MEKLYTLNETARVMGTTDRFPRRLVADRRDEDVDDHGRHDGRRCGRCRGDLFVRFRFGGNRIR